jgi:hypothetical protein
MYQIFYWLVDCNGLFRLNVNVFWIFLMHISWIYFAHGLIDYIVYISLRSQVVKFLQFQTILLYYNDFFLWRDCPLMGQCLLIVETLPSRSDMPHSVGPLWASDQLGAETSTWQHATLTRDKYPCPRRDSKPQSQQASGRETYDALQQCDIRYCNTWPIKAFVYL